MSLDKEFQYFLDNKEDLLKKYSGKHVVIKDNEVKGAFASIKEAYLFASEEFELGTFLIQECTSDEESYTQTFHSRVMFS